jgi:chromosomal replication initiator protein
MQTFAAWVPLPENQAARAAAERVAEAPTGRPGPALNPLFLHGPSGTGKTHLVAALALAVTTRAPDRVVHVLPAGDFAPPAATDEGRDAREAVRGADLVAVEDLQHLDARAADALAGLLDRGLARGQQWVVTANAGPAELTHLPGRLTSRLAGGLVVGLRPPAPASRLRLLEAFAQRRGVALARPVLDWLAEHTEGSARRREGALGRVETLARVQGRPPSAEEVAAAFRVEAEARRPTVERIAQRVCRYFRVEPGALQGRGRARGALVPRQVGMYLARQLTGLSLGQIGAYFGGRDHSTVLHACRKVEAALAQDVTLSGAVRQLHADLA